MTYDREVLKFDAGKLAKAHQALYAPLRELSEAARSQAYTVAYWRFEDTAARAASAGGRRGPGYSWMS